MASLSNAAMRWRRDPVAFIREVLVNPETGKPFALYPEEETFIRAAFTVKLLGPESRGVPLDVLAPPTG